MNERYSRQNFLGDTSDELFARLDIGIVGLGGGGSHIAQQLAHLGVKNFVLADDDAIEESNLNRLVGGTKADVEAEEKKVNILSRLIIGINPDAQVSAHIVKWQTIAEELRDCDCIFGCVDSLEGRSQLEAFCRRFLIPYIDIGIDVLESKEGFIITGHIARSLPDAPCLRCLNVLNDKIISKEVLSYGAAGGKPQVVWSNGVVASTAIGMFVELFTPWFKAKSAIACVDYDGNRHTVEVSNRMNFPAVKEGICEHYRREDVGDPLFNRT